MALHTHTRCWNHIVKTAGDLQSKFMLLFILCVVCIHRCAFLTTLKISKLVLTSVGYAQVHVVAEACQSESSGTASQITVTPVMHNHAVILQKALQCVPNPNTDFIMRNTASRLGQFLTRQVSYGFYIFSFSSI